MDDDENKIRLFTLPEGFVGWAGNISIPVSSFKMYGTYVTENYIQQNYEEHARSVGLDILRIHPKKPDESLEDVFFKHSR